MMQSSQRRWPGLATFSILLITVYYFISHSSVDRAIFRAKLSVQPPNESNDSRGSNALNGLSGSNSSDGSTKQIGSNSSNSSNSPNISNGPNSGQDNIGRDQQISSAPNRAFLSPPRTFWGREVDPSFSSVINSMFPIDSIVSYNTSGSSTTREAVARYASFSPVLDSAIYGEYVFVAGSACSEIDASAHPEYKDKILIVRRGRCLFVRKLANIQAADLRPRAVIVANNVPHSGLITMYSRTFNRDEQLRFPVLFMSHEDAEDLRVLDGQNVELAIRTASLDGFLGLVLSITVSPPLVILMCYLIIRGMQLWRRRHRSKINQQFVRSLPVHIYNRSHLVPAPQFYDYVVSTRQTNDIPSVSSSVDDFATSQEHYSRISHDPHDPYGSRDPHGSPMLANSLGSSDAPELRGLHVLHAGKDFYSTQKCSICLGRYVSLKSRVLVLGCKHMFHEKCLSNWLINFRKTCPLCNEALQMPEDHPEGRPEAHSETQPLVGHGSTGYGSLEVDLEENLEGNIEESLEGNIEGNLEGRLTGNLHRSSYSDAREENRADSDVMPATEASIYGSVASHHSSTLTTQNQQAASVDFKREYRNRDQDPDQTQSADRYQDQDLELYLDLDLDPDSDDVLNFQSQQHHHSSSTRVADSNTSFVTTKSHQSSAGSHLSSATSFRTSTSSSHTSASSYHTSASVNNADVNSDAQSHESSRSTLQFQ